VWQLLDLGTFKEMMVDGAHGKLSATFNRVRGDRGADSFGLTLAAFRGHPEDAAELWLRRSDSALALIEDVIVTDADPTTWEKFEIGTTLPAETDFLVVELRAIGPAAETGVAPAFPGHFADDVVFKLRVPLRASSLAAAP
jgi:hypothetical protein